MNLYIETENGVTKKHPAFGDNLIQAFGAVPTHWEPFTRVDCPALNVYEIAKNDYVKVNGIWTDVWTTRGMTAEEKAAKQQAVRDAFAARDQAENWSAWMLDDATCTMQPPIPRPSPIKDVLVFWCGADANWKDTPARPVDDNQYRFDFFAWQWNAVVN
jgi:hypothetical protein